MSVYARLEDHRLDPAAELDELTRVAGGDGAVVTFVGLARDTAHGGQQVEKLVLERHPHLTTASLEQIASHGAARFKVSHVRVVHRCGDIRPGEAIVFAGASAVHRREAFEAVDYLMDRLKTEAVFWKREEGPSGSSWIEPTEKDYADRGRWE
ncbi:molybdenum cofactor biosynthesis protein MoaE [Sphingomonas daechungensis]|uniref:molybdenum cofactor biosynthesis protein MoaE n=1 Tax=Sphingomonas daechungensis TaxID=1176646 RepID=UPI0031E75C31